MRIALEVQPVLAPLTGVGRHTLQLVRHLLKLDSDNEFRLFYFNFLGRSALPALPDNPRAKPAPSRLPGRLVYALWNRVAWPAADRLAGGADVFHCPNFFLRPLARARSVLTIHDLSFLRFPQYCERRNRRHLTRLVPPAARRADRILAVSEFTKREIVELLGVPAAKITVTPNGVDGAFRPGLDPAPVRKRLGLDDGRPYLVHAGTLEPRKNLPAIIAAFGRLKEKGFPHRLVLAGGRGWLDGGIFAAAAASPAKDDILFPGYLQDGELAPLLCGADLFLFASRYEGFGMPPLEAMACGLPVVAAAIPAAREVLGEAALLAAPDDEEALAAGAEKALEDGELRARLRAAGPARAAEFSWERTAKLTLQAYEEAAT